MNFMKFLRWLEQAEVFSVLTYRQYTAKISKHIIFAFSGFGRRENSHFLVEVKKGPFYLQL